MLSRYANVYALFERMLLQTFHSSPENLSLYRIIYGTLMLLVLSPHLDFVEPLPEYLFSPPMSFAALFDSPLSSSTITAIRYGLAIALMSLTIGYRTCLSSLAVACLLVVLNSAIYSTGKINHTILVVAVPLVLAFSAWGSRFSLDSLTGRRLFCETAIPMGLLALVISIAMATAGWTKFKSGWLALDASAVKHYVYDFWVIRGCETAMLRPLVAGTPQWTWELKDWSTVGIELAGLIAVFRRRWFFTWLATACALHIGVSVMMRINFPSNVLAYGAFYPWVLLFGFPRSTHGELRIRKCDAKMNSWRNQWAGTSLAAGALLASVGLLFLFDELPSTQSRLEIAKWFVVWLPIPLIAIAGYRTMRFQSDRHRSTSSNLPVDSKEPVTIDQESRSPIAA